MSLSSIRYKQTEPNQELTQGGARRLKSSLNKASSEQALFREFQEMLGSSPASLATIVLSLHTDTLSDRLLISVALISHCRDAVADSKKLSRMDTLLLQDYLS